MNTIYWLDVFFLDIQRGLSFVLRKFSRKTTNLLHRSTYFNIPAFSAWETETMEFHDRENFLKIHQREEGKPFFTSRSFYCITRPIFAFLDKFKYIALFDISLLLLVTKASYIRATYFSDHRLYYRLYFAWIEINVSVQSVYLRCCPVHLHSAISV